MNQFTDISKYEDIISLGNNCDPGLSLRELGLKKETYPFDWIRSNPKIIYDVLVNGPEKYIEFGNPDANNYDIQDNFEIKHMYACFNKNQRIIPISHINYYGQHFTHYLNATTDEVKKTFTRYMKRFFDKLHTSRSIVFLHTTENYILHKLSRDNSDIYYDYLLKIAKYLNKNYPSLIFKIVNIEVDNRHKNTEHILNYSMDYTLAFSDRCEAHKNEYLTPFRNEVTRVLNEILLPHTINSITGKNIIPQIPSGAENSSSQVKLNKVAFYYSLQFQLRVLEPIASEFENTLITSDVEELETWMPDVIFTADSALIPSLRKICDRDNMILVGLRHGIANKYIPVESEYSQADYVCGSSWDKKDFNSSGVKPKKDFLITGNPWVDSIFKIPKRDINKENPTILFAPTYNPEVSAAVFFMGDLVPLIRKVYPKSKIIIKPHPAIIDNEHHYVSMHRDLFKELINIWEKDAVVDKNIEFINDSKAAISNFYFETDILISDGSSLVFEFMALNRPILLYTSDNKIKIWKDIYDNSALANSKRNVGIEFKTKEDFIKALSNAFDLHIKNHSKFQQEYAQEILGEFTDGLSYKRVAESVKSIINNSLSNKRRKITYSLNSLTKISETDVTKETTQQNTSPCNVIAFYLPQYHPIPENDEWWGKGFTEWTNVAKAKPLFPGHYQPHLPADLGFYDLRLPEVRKAQAELAQKYGIQGFCYYHYWFNGKQLLNRVFDEVLTSGEPNFPFCLCWANENWTRVWDGGNKKILIGQQYSKEDDIEHIRWFIRAFRDPRYIKVYDKPLLLIYRANNLPDKKNTADIWREEVRKAGFPDLYLCNVESFIDESSDPSVSGFDACIEFQPDWSNLGEKSDRHPELNVFDYNNIVKNMVGKSRPEYKRFPCVTPSWDNSPRRGRDGVIFHKSNPALYERWLRHAVSIARENVPEERIVFINAWNEWGEGNHLEPDQRNGLVHLYATKRALTIESEEAALIVEITEKATDALKKGDAHEAERLLIEVLEHDPYAPEALHQYAVLQFQQGKVEEAIVMIHRAVDRDPGNAEFHNDLGTMYYASGDIINAQKHFEISLDIDPQDSSLLKNLTELFIAKKQYIEARDVCSRLRTIYPDDNEAEQLWSLIQESSSMQASQNFTEVQNNIIPLTKSTSSQDISQLAPNTLMESGNMAPGLVCLQPFYMMEFTTNGLVYTCCPAWTKISIGHIGQSSISEIWNSKQARLLRRKILEGNFQEVCNEICPHISEYHHTGKLIKFNELDRIEALTPQLIEEIRSGKDQLDSTPTVFNLSNSTVCNLSCIMCTRHSDGSNPELVEKTATDLQSYLKNAKRMTLSGMGDPFARPDTRSLMIKNTNKDLIFDLITNSLLLPRYWNDVRHCCFGNLLVSMDAPDKKIYEKIRKGGKWEDLLKSLSLIRENKDRFQSVTLNMTVMRENMALIPEFINFAESYGFNASFQRIRGTFGDQNIFEMNDTKALNCLSDIVTAEKNRKRSTSIYLADLLEFVQKETPSTAVTNRSISVNSDVTITKNEDANFKAVIAELKKANQEDNVRACQEMSPTMKGGPLTAIISVGSKCNLRCQMCFRTINHTKGVNMPWSIFEKTFEILPTLQRAKLIGAGEPFLNPDYFNMLEAVKKFDLATETVSNGTLISDEIAKKVVLSGLGSLCISLDGATASTYESIRRGAKFDNVIEGIKRINKYKKEFGSNTPVMGFSTVIMKRNINELSAVIELAGRLNLSWVTVLYLTVFSPSLFDESLFFYRELSDKRLTEARERAAQLGIHIDMPGLFRDANGMVLPSKRKKCFEPWQMVMIEVGGEVLPCCTYGTPLGNLNDTSFFDIWDSEKYQELRRRVNSDDPPDPCKHCSNSTVAHSVNDIRSHIRCEIPPELEKPGQTVGKTSTLKEEVNINSKGFQEHMDCLAEDSNGENKNNEHSCDTSETLHESAIQHFQQGNLDKAIEIMSRALLMCPQNAEFHNDLGAIYHSSGDTSMAQTCFENALKIDPMDISALKNLTDLFISNNRFQEADVICNKLESVCVDDDEVHKQRISIDAALKTRFSDDSANSINKNRLTWSNYDWPENGNEWSRAWGGTENLWMKTLLPRIRPNLPADHILEIAPGFGRITRFLIPECRKLSIVDLTEKCINACRQHFKAFSHINYFVNDGKSLDMIEDNTIDFVFSWDSLVHVESDVIHSYLRQLASKLKPGGRGFFHHSNIGAYKDTLTGKLTVENPHWRGESMSAKVFRDHCKEAGLQCISQEIIAWGGSVLNDCISVFVKNVKGVPSETLILESPDFMDEAKGVKVIPDIYKHVYSEITEAYRQDRCKLKITQDNSGLSKDQITEKSIVCTLNDNIKIENNNNFPFLISIILSVKNNQKFIHNRLQSILENLPNQSIEIIVVDNGSQDGTRDFLNLMSQKNLKIIMPEGECNNIQGAVMGAQSAYGRYLLFLDDTVFFTNSLIPNLIKALKQNSEWDCLTGKTASHKGIIIEAGSTTLSKTGTISRGAGSSFHDPAYNFTCQVDSGSLYAILMHRDVWNDVNGLNPDFENLASALLDLGLRIASRGYHILYHPECVFVSNPAVCNEKPATDSKSPDPELLLSLRPKNLPPEIRTVLGRSISSHVLILGIYLANTLNTISDITAIFSRSINHDVTQKWVALNGLPPDQETAKFTVNQISGKIPKFQIINEFIGKEDLSYYDYIILCDDDVVLPEYFVDDFIAMQSGFDFAIAQPARTINSYIDHPIVQQHIGVHARQTQFVEIGPVVSFHRSAYEIIFPFDMTSPMGWGYENVWAYKIIQKNLKMGIIDAIPVDHSIRKPVVNYEWGQADKERAAYLNKHDHLTIEECFRVEKAHIVSEESIWNTHP